MSRAAAQGSHRHALEVSTPPQPGTWVYAAGSAARRSMASPSPNPAGTVVRHPAFDVAGRAEKTSPLGPRNSRERAMFRPASRRSSVIGRPGQLGHACATAVSSVSCVYSPTKAWSPLNCKNGVPPTFYSESVVADWPSSRAGVTGTTSFAFAQPALDRSSLPTSEWDVDGLHNRVRDGRIFESRPRSRPRVSQLHGLGGPLSRSSSRRAPVITRWAQDWSLP